MTLGRVIFIRSFGLVNHADRILRVLQDQIDIGTGITAI
jgi:hypothetical protein